MEKQVKWEMRMHKARELRKKGSELLFDRVTLLVSCYVDDEFRAFHASNGTNELDFLDDELNDTAASFLTLKAVLDSYPAKDEWVKHNIRDLIALVLEAEAESRKRPSEDKRVSWKERALAAEAECERLRGQVAQMQESLGIVAAAKCK